MTQERWTVQEWNDDYECWFVWGGKSIDWRFYTYENAVNAYEDRKQNIHYSPCMYRFCKIEIQPEAIISTEVVSTFQLDGKEINLTTKDVESEEMKFT